MLMSRDTECYPAVNPPGLEPDRKPPAPADTSAKQPAPEGGPTQPEAGVPRPESAAGREEREELSVEKLKQELFDREVPEENKRIITEFPGFHARDPISPLL